MTEETRAVQTNGVKDFYQRATYFLLGFIIAGVASFFAAQKDMITRREFAEENERYERHLEANDRRLADLTQDLQLAKVDLALITEDLKLTTHPVPSK